MNLRSILRISKAYNDLGWSIQEQLVQFVNDDGADLNSNAVRDFKRWVELVKREAERQQDTELVLDCANTLDLIEDYLL